MLILPCFISLVRRRLNVSKSPSFDRDKGSQKPVGGWTPRSFSNAAIEIALKCLVAFFLELPDRALNLPNIKAAETLKIAKPVVSVGPDALDSLVCVELSPSHDWPKPVLRTNISGTFPLVPSNENVVPIS